MDYIIDGYNLIGKTETICLTEKNKEALLVEWMVTLSFKPKDQIYLIFDGKHEGYPYGSKEKKGFIQLIFTPLHQTADDYIKAKLKKIKKPTILVTSDKDIGESMKNNRLFRWLTSETFLSTMSPQKKHKGEKPLRISNGEVDFWLQQWQ